MGPPALQAVPRVSLSPSLVGAEVQHWCEAAQRHQQASSSLQVSHLPPWATATSPASTPLHVGCFSA